MENDDNVMEFWNFYYCTEQFCKSDTTSRTANELVLDCCEIFVNMCK